MVYPRKAQQVHALLDFVPPWGQECRVAVQYIIKRGNGAVSELTRQGALGGGNVRCPHECALPCL